MTRTWLITGISRGLGRELARVALSNGDRVVGTTRSGSTDLDHAGLDVLALDVTDADAVTGAVEAAIALTGGLDVVVNNAGYGLLGPIEATSEAEASAVLDTNLLGPLRVARAVAPHLRERGCGIVVNVSSIAGLAPLGGSGVYAAAKAGVSALSEALATELAPFGVAVVSVEPGSLRTDFFSSTSIRHTDAQPASYAQTTGAVVEMMTARAGAEPGDPASVARLIADVVAADVPPRHLVVGADAMQRARENALALLADIDAWAERSAATAHPDA